MDSGNDTQVYNLLINVIRNRTKNDAEDTVTYLTSYAFSSLRSAHLIRDFAE